MQKLPQLITIHYEDTTYYVYPSTEAYECYICKHEGHIAKQCPTANESAQEFPALIIPLISSVTSPNKFSNAVNKNPPLQSSNSFTPTVDAPQELPSTIPLDCISTAEEKEDLNLSLSQSYTEPPGNERFKRPLSVSSNNSVIPPLSKNLSDSDSSLDSNCVENNQKTNTQDDKTHAKPLKK